MAAVIRKLPAAAFLKPSFGTKLQQVLFREKITINVQNHPKYTLHIFFILKLFHKTHYKRQCEQPLTEIPSMSYKKSCQYILF